MSNVLAIAAVTSTLKNLLDTQLPEMLASALPGAMDMNQFEVTAKPLDKARIASNPNQLNLFLYQTTTNEALNNRELPGERPAGESARPPVALDLHYLVTAYGSGDDDTAAHVLLGHAMRILHDNAVLGCERIEQALEGNDLHEQIERVRITPQPLTLEELSKLWATFQTQYRVSAAYRVSVVLIESELPSRTPLPVLMRGAGDSGVASQPSLVPPFPTLEELRLPDGQPSALLGDTLTIRGHDLGGTNRVARFSHRRLDVPREVGVTGTTDVELTVTIPDEPAELPAGLYILSVLVQRPGETFRRATNELPLALAPQMTLPPDSITRDGGTVTITLSCRPDVRGGQRVSLLLASRELPAEAFGDAANTLTFIAEDLAPGEYPVRLRVDGVDSLLIDRTLTPPQFDPSQVINVP